MINNSKELKGNLNELKEFLARETGKRDKTKEQLQAFKENAKQKEDKVELLGKVGDRKSVV